MRILVTGAAGFIGSNYVHYLLEHTDDIEVISLDALTYAGDKINLEPVLDDERHEFVEGDIRDAELVDELVSRADVIVNFAAESHVDRSIDGSAPFVSTNVEGVQVLCDAALEADIDCFVQISTDEVYGEVLEGTSAEDDRLNPRNPYAATKASADHLAYSYYVTHDLPVKITRSSNNYGPRQHKEKLIPKMISLAKDRKELPLYGDGTNVREWIYVRDNCRAIEEVRTSGAVGEVCNIGSGDEKTNLAVAEAILDMVGGSEDLITFVEDRPGHDYRYALDTTKIRSLGWEPEVSFDEGLKRTIDYYSN